MYMHRKGLGMATKTISIDMDAYRRLTRARRGQESFSRVIHRMITPPFDLDAYLARLTSSPLDDATAEAIEQHEQARHRPTRRER